MAKNLATWASLFDVPSVEGQVIFAKTVKVLFWMRNQNRLCSGRWSHGESLGVDSYWSGEGTSTEEEAWSSPVIDSDVGKLKKLYPSFFSTLLSLSWLA
jgi:hypothetical protein